MSKYLIIVVVIWQQINYEEMFRFMFDITFAIDYIAIIYLLSVKKQSICH